jgi:hypothetical protein
MNKEDKIDQLLPLIIQDLGCECLHGLLVPGKTCYCLSDESPFKRCSYWMNNESFSECNYFELRKYKEEVPDGTVTGGESQ